MKRVATATEPPVVIPVIVIAVDVHVPLVVPPIEGRKIVQDTICPTTPEYSQGWNIIRHLKCPDVLYQVSSFFYLPNKSYLFRVKCLHKSSVLSRNLERSQLMDTGFGGRKPH